MQKDKEGLQVYPRSFGLKICQDQLILQAYVQVDKHGLLFEQNDVKHHHKQLVLFTTRPDLVGDTFLSDTIGWVSRESTNEALFETKHSRVTYSDI